MLRKIFKKKQVNEVLSVNVILQLFLLTGKGNRHEGFIETFEIRLCLKTFPLSLQVMPYNFPFIPSGYAL